MTRGSNNLQVELVREDIELIMGADLAYFDAIVENLYCSHCVRHSSPNMPYNIYLDEHNDILLKAVCNSCNGPIIRYIQTSKNNEKRAIAKHLREVIVKYTVADKEID